VARMRQDVGSLEVGAVCQLPAFSLRLDQRPCSTSGAFFCSRSNGPIGVWCVQDCPRYAYLRGLWRSQKAVIRAF